MVNRKDRLTDKEYKIISDHAGNIDNYQQHHTIEIGQQTLTVHDFLKVDHQLYGLTMQPEAIRPSSSSLFTVRCQSKCR